MNFSTLPPLANLYEVRPTQSGNRYALTGPAILSEFCRRTVQDALQAARILAGVRGGEVRLYDEGGQLVVQEAVQHCQ